jgi:hypothetical protein
LGPAIAGYIGAGTNWRDSFGILTALYGLSTAMVLLFGRETYYVPGKTGTRVGSYFGVGNTELPKLATIADRCRTLVIYVFKFPLFLTGIAVLVTFTWPIGKSTFNIKILSWSDPNPDRNHNHHRYFPTQPSIPLRYNPGFFYAFCRCHWDSLRFVSIVPVDECRLTLSRVPSWSCFQRVDLPPPLSQLAH